jgi:hypothetical protein
MNESTTLFLNESAKLVELRNRLKNVSFFLNNNNNFKKNGFKNRNYYLKKLNQFDSTQLIRKYEILMCFKIIVLILSIVNIYFKIFLKIIPILFIHLYYLRLCFILL